MPSAVEPPWRGLLPIDEDIEVLSPDWSADVLRFWFDESGPDRWFSKDPVFDETVRRRFLALHEALAACPSAPLLGDARTALAAVIVFDQMSRNMFRDTARAFAMDSRALSIAQEAIDRGFEAGLTKDERLFLYLPFEHAEDAAAQARCVALIATLGDAELTKWAEAHRSVIDRFGRFPHRNRVLGRTSTPEETEFLTQPGSSF
jgi:uncharacterized protein (DUF924 family)